VAWASRILIEIQPACASEFATVLQLRMVRISLEVNRIRIHASIQDEPEWQHNETPQKGPNRKYERIYKTLFQGFHSAAIPA
jgi:hypothetical protein